MTMTVFSKGLWSVEWHKNGTYWLIGPDGYRRSYGPFKAKAIAACKRHKA